MPPIRKHFRNLFVQQITISLTQCLTSLNDRIITHVTKLLINLLIQKNLFVNFVCVNDNQKANYVIF